MFNQKGTNILWWCFYPLSKQCQEPAESPLRHFLLLSWIIPASGTLCSFELNYFRYPWPSWPPSSSWVAVIRSPRTFSSFPAPLPPAWSCRCDPRPGPGPWPWWTSHSWPHQPRDRGLLVNCRAELNFLLCPRQAWNNPGIYQLLQAGMFYFIGTDWKDPANLMMSQKKDSLWTVLLQLIRRGVLSLIIPDDGKKINLMFCTKDVKGNDSIRNKTAGGEKPPYERFFDTKWIKRIKDLRTEDGTITQPPPQMLDFPLRFFK